MAVQLSESAKAAWKWLKDHNGDGGFDKNGVLLAGGEQAPFMRSTWNTLRDAGAVEFYRNGQRGRPRVRVNESPGFDS